MPVPLVGKDGDAYRWLDEHDLPQTIGRLSDFMGNTGVLLRAYVYMRMLGRDGMQRVAEFSTLNANYLMARLRAAGFELAYPERRASHEFIVTLRRKRGSGAPTRWISRSACSTSASMRRRRTSRCSCRSAC